jgi:hypothetical protein
MEKFLEKIQKDIDNKMLACIKGESIVKPFTQVYNEVRQKIQAEVENKHGKEEKSTIYTKNEESIYTAVVLQFLEEHPELREKK